MKTIQVILLSDYPLPIHIQFLLLNIYFKTKNSFASLVIVTLKLGSQIDFIWFLKFILSNHFEYH